MKQPHEDIKGSPLSDDLLSLDEKAVAHRDALIGMARLLHKACLVGDAAPVVVRIYDRLTKPQPGDLVVGMSAMYSRDGDHRLKGLGILLEKRVEWMETDEEWAELVADEEADTDERFTDEAWYIQYGPNAEDVCRWTDCMFIALPHAEKLSP